MKLLICLSLAAFSSTVFACPDLSGNYLSDSTFEAISIEQAGCTAIKYTFEDGKTSKVSTDGKEYLVNKFEVEDETIEIYQTNTFTADKLLTIGRYEATSTDGTKESHKATTESTLDANKNIVRVAHLEDGTDETTTLLRDNSIN
jgi:hypothetical protein